jgi:YVTN family beta-propeller protein
MRSAAGAAGRREAARRTARRRLRRQRLGAAAIVAAVAAGAVAFALADTDRKPAADVRRAAPARPAGPVAALPAAAAPATHALVGVAVRPAGTLPEPLASGVAVASGRGALVAGGLGADDTSRTTVIRVGGGGPARLALRLPQALHDVAAAALGGTAYVFGGGDGSAQHAGILALRGAAAAPVGSLPAASSDAAAAVLGDTAYVVGGYDGRRFLDSIVAWRPGRAARVVARTPSPLRYAAVAAAGGRVLVAGGIRPDGSTTNAVLAYDPARRAVHLLARLRRPLSHATAASLDGFVLVVGGRSADGAPRRAILAVDPRSGAVRQVGSLPVPLADAMAVTTRDGVLVVGGAGPAGRVATVERIVPRGFGPARTSAPAPRGNVYAFDRAGLLTGPARHARPLVYVPSGEADTVTVIDQRTFRVVGHYAAGGLPQHITPSYDLRTLWVSNNRGNTLQAFDPRSGRPRGAPVAVDDPYNLYFTPDGRFGIVVEERNQELAFRDPHTWRLVRSLPLPCTGVDHLDFSASGSYLLASCEFSGEVVRVDLPSLRIHGPLRLGFGARPQDVKLAPDGRVFYVADMAAGGLYLVGGAPLRVRGFVRTGAGAHGIYPSRDARFLYVSNRAAGTVSVLDVATRRVVRTWTIPNGSPDMGGVSADGRTLWLSGRYSSEVYAIDTRSGRLRARIPVDAGPHGLCVWPQPGRYSLGHTGILR